MGGIKNNILISLFVFFSISYIGAQNPQPVITHSSNCEEVTFYDNTVNTGSYSIDSARLDFGDGYDTILAPWLQFFSLQHTYTAPNKYNIKYVLYFFNGSNKDSAQYLNDTVKYFIPSANFNTSQSCDTVFLYDQSSGNGGSIDSIYWHITSNSGVNDILKLYPPQPMDSLYVMPVNGKYKFLMSVYEGGCEDTLSNYLSYYSIVLDSIHTQFHCDTVFFTPYFDSINLVDKVIWEFGDGNSQTVLSTPFSAQHIYSVNDSATFFLKMISHSIYGCYDTTILPVYIEHPKAGFLADIVCLGEFTSFTDTSWAPNIGLSWTWNFGDGNFSNLQNPVHQFSQHGYHSVKLTVTNNIGCPDSIANTIFVDSVPQPDFTYDTACFGNETQFTNLTYTGTFLDSLSWQWDFGDGSFSNLQHPAHLFTQPGIHAVQLKVFNTTGCLDSIMKNVFVDSVPQPDFTYDTACVGSVTQFTNLTYTGTFLDSLSWYWDFGDGSFSVMQHPLHLFTNPGLYTVQLKVYNTTGCIDSIFKDVFIDSVPQPDFICSSNCFGDTAFFSNLTDTTYLGSSIFDSLSWKWYFDDPASAPYDTSSLYQPTHVFSSEGQYNVKLIVFNNNGCMDSIVHTINVDSLPEPLFTFSNVSVGNTVIFHDLSVPHGTNTFIIDREWDFGDGTTASNIYPYVPHIYSDTGTYVACLTVTQTNGCSNTLCDTVTITPRPIADFDYSSGVTKFTEFYDQSISPVGIKNWHWDFGDNSSTQDTSNIQNPYYNYPDTGYYYVYLQVVDSNGGVKDTTKQIYVGSAVLAQFIYSSACSGQPNLFIDESYSPVEAPILEWHWDFGDGTDTIMTQETYADSIYHVYDTAGVYDVMLVIMTDYWNDTVRDTTIHQVYVHHLPVADFDSVTACKGSQFTLNNTTSSVDSIISWYWNFGDGSHSTQENPTQIYDTTGIFTIMLQATTVNGCTDTVYKECLVNTAPIVSFNIENNCLNSPTYFIPVYDTSVTEITSWLWDFGDPLAPDSLNTSEEPYPSHIYTTIKEYTASMTAATYGCPKTIQKSFLVYPIPFSEFDLIPDYGGVQGKTQFTNNSIYAERFLWDFGNGNTSVIENPIEVYEEDSLYTVTLISYNEYGCSDTSRHEVNVLFKGLYFPSAFSPLNPNEEIRYFEPKGYNLLEYHVYLYDVKGNLVWEADELDENGSPTQKWDGYYNGILQPEGTYIWKAYGVFRDGTPWEGTTLQTEDPSTSGTVTLIR